MTIREAIDAALDKPAEQLLVPHYQADPAESLRLRRLVWLMLADLLDQVTDKEMAALVFGANVAMDLRRLQVMMERARELTTLLHHYPEMYDAIIESILPQLQERLPFVDLNDDPWSRM